MTTRPDRSPPADDAVAPDGALTKQDFEALAQFRFAIRRYLRFSEDTVREHGLTPQQYQLMLALKGFPHREWATVGELAEQLQLRPHSAAELITRAQKQGLVQRGRDSNDGRVVRVELTDAGETLLAQLSRLHRTQLRHMRTALSVPP
ncbi:MarR family transcriptional regulator [Pseudonocardia sulfidoxydans NBRC 16205]|uniref:MarR family transcriptional regulator n=1 Tax=Pseudonocardia sulfidoxydans NBRC 16205 TaxID=1223511 RepID=A0A511DJU8_9PSEU|nr:MarR family winged helix-turn-helix transcriptional regulator [Pseudonocardia sulfidoxydans]GEL25091.1 MarR family transcriptional regulator [Pseudonocardia sulfidoxydans NBRC 16205]